MKAQTVKELSLAIAATVLLALAARHMHAQSPPPAAGSGALNPNDLQPPPVQPQQETSIAVQSDPNRRLVPTQVSIPGGGGAYIYSESGDASDPRSKSLQELNALLKQLKDSNEENRAEVAKKVETALTAYFDLDMKNRKEELERLTKRADDTAARLKKRADSRTELIDLQLKSYEQDAKGLGLFGAQGRNTLSIRTTTGAGGMGMSGSVLLNRMRGNEKENPLEAAMNQIRAAQSKLEAAKTDEEKTAAVKELNAALGTYFDRDMEQKQEDLLAVREDLKDMQSKLKTRSDSKPEIVALQLKLFVNEADGLGFFTNGSNQQTGLPSMLGGGYEMGDMGYGDYGGANPFNLGTAGPRAGELRSR